MSKIQSISQFCLLIFAFFIFENCNSSTNPNTELAIQTDNSTYQFTDVLSIELSVSNEDEHPVYYICTGQIYLEEIVNGEIINTWMVHGFEECLAERIIESDGMENFRIIFNNIFLPRVLETGRFDDATWYQLRIDLYPVDRDRPSLRPDQLRSNRFQIIRA